jgi:hypothetical protein
VGVNLDQTFTLRELYEAIDGTDNYPDAIAVLVRDAQTADKAPEQEVIVLMTVADYDTAESNLARQPVKTEEGDWYCWSMGLKAYWKPSGKMSPAGWPGHTVRCGRYEVPPWPLEEEDTT